MTTEVAANEVQAQLLKMIGDAPKGMTVSDLLQTPEWMTERAGSLALRCTALCRKGLLKKAGEREGKSVFVLGDGTKMQQKPRSKRIEISNSAASVPESTSPTVPPSTKSPAFQAGYAVFSNLLEARRQLDDFIEGFRKAMNG